MAFMAGVRGKNRTFSEQRHLPHTAAQQHVLGRFILFPQP
jgi:hypothetical protein